MSFNKNVLKNLLNKLLENRLQKLEKRTTDQLKDLKLAKTQYKKQGEALSKLSIKKPIKKPISKGYTRQKTFDNTLNKSTIINHKGKQYLKLSPSKNTKIRSRNDLPSIQQTLSKNMSTNRVNQNGNFHNNKYKNVKPRFLDDPNIKINPSNKKLYLTPDPKLKRRKKIKDKRNVKINNIQPKKLNLLSEKNNKVENKNQIRNINTIKREEDYKKNTIVSDIDLEAGKIDFVLDYLRKEKENKTINNNENESQNENDDDNDKDDDSSEKKNSSKSNSSNSSSNSNSSNNSNKSSSGNIRKYVMKNKEIVTKFGKYLISSEGSDIISLICSFLDKKAKIRFLSISKKLIRQLTYYLDDLYKNILNINKITFSNTLEDKINYLKKTYKEDQLIEAKHAFTLSKGSLKALDLLNSDSYNNVFKIKQLEPPLDKIILVYKIFFQLIGKEELVKIENEKKFWEKTRKFILDNNEGKTGTFLKDYISEFDFTSENIYKLELLINGNEDKLKPLNYENICKTTGLVIFMIKDSLEYCGIIKNDKKNMPSIMLNYLIYLQNNLNRAKDYIEKLKEL